MPLKGGRRQLPPQARRAMLKELNAPRPQPGTVTVDRETGKEVLHLKEGAPVPKGVFAS